MIKSKCKALEWAHPLVQEWFIEKFDAPTEPQIKGWPFISAGKTTLISAPTGSGKTLAAFLVCLDFLIRKALSKALTNETEVVYVSPLKALSNDIQKNLQEPLAEIYALAQKRNLKMMGIRVAVRTGDTLAAERVAMLKNPPHLLITTPESFFILLTAEKSRLMLKTVKTVIIDEIHALVDNKRGVHLALSLERLQAMTHKIPARIGLSATQKPIELVADFLRGNHCVETAIVDIGYVRALDIAIEVPKSPLAAVASNEMWDEIYNQIAELSKDHSSTLVFVNTRKLAERVAHHLSGRIGKDYVTAHHGSLSRKLRLNAETKLKNGTLKILVATASLELGIDIGSVDLVCLLGTPKAIAVALQRVGRAGHWHGAISKGRIFATTRDELVECAALVYAIEQKQLDTLAIPLQPLDILSQQIVAACATNEWQTDDLFKLITAAYPYKNLLRADFDSVITMLAEGIAGSRGRYGTYLFQDKVNGIIKARRGARLAAITSGGAIPESGLFTVIAEPNGLMVGTLDEDFAVESNRGDIILLGTTSWKIKRVEGFKSRVLVEDAHGAPPSVPFWRGEAPARTTELSESVSNLRQKISGILLEDLKGPNPEALNWLIKNCKLDQAGAEQIIEYLQEGKSLLGVVPTQKTIIAERFFDEGGGMQLIIHAPFGARINKAWGLALRKRFCRSFNFELQAAATDDGINISLTEQHSFPLADVFNFLHPKTLKEVLIQAVLQSPIFATRWRWTATRSLALARFRSGKKVPPPILRILSDDLLAAVFPDAAACQDNLGGRDIEIPDHPLINEAIHDALTEALDVEGLINIIQNIIAGHINCIAIDTPTPSVFSHEILNANPYAYLDDAPLEERRARAVTMRRVLPESILKEIGKLDQEAITTVQQQAWPDIRDEDELHDFLQTLIALPASFLQHNGSIWSAHFKSLVAEGRAIIAEKKEKYFCVAVEKAKNFLKIYPDYHYLYRFKNIENVIGDREDELQAMLRGWLQHLGPTTINELAAILNLKVNEIEQTLLKLEAAGTVLRGQFRSLNEREWCDRRLLARIHKLTLGRLRKEIAPVTAAQYVTWLSHWQHAVPGTQLRGEHGLLEIINQLQGFEIPANAWESQIFSKRIADYNTSLLDHLCLTGAVGWGRLTPHPAILTSVSVQQSIINLKKRILPTSVAPITFFVREESEWLVPHPTMNANDLSALSHSAKRIYNFLKSRGASFFTDICRHQNYLKSEIETALWQLISAGLITADAFDNLRALIDPRRRLNRLKRRNSLRQGTGRWYVLHTEDIDQNIQAEALCQVLLKRYGVVFRELLAREKNLPPWRDLLKVFRSLEDKGTIRGGCFVSGFLGEQFALPYAVESLRASKATNQTDFLLTISAVDPLNLHGIILPGDRVPALSGKYCTLNFRDYSIGP